MTAAKEAQARIKINQLPEESGWRFFDDKNGKANIVLEPNIKLTQTQMPGYANEVGWKNEVERETFIEKNRLRFMRKYQIRALHSIQEAIKEGKSRFLFEITTGTGKTLTAAAVVKLFLRTGNARAVFEYFVGYKLGLTATPKNYLKKFDQDKPTTRDPRELERRLLLDTYRTFGCDTGQPTFRSNDVHISAIPDAGKQLREQQIGYEGMKIDRMFFEKFEDKIKDDPILQQKIEAEHWDQAVDYVVKELFDKPKEYFNLDKLRKAAGVDRRLSVREILEKIFGLIPDFKSRDEMLEDEFQKFLLDAQPDYPETMRPIKYYFKAYTTDGRLREIIASKHFTELNVNPGFQHGRFQIGAA